VLLEHGDHVCTLYNSSDELAEIAADFLAEGLRKHERCWYVPSGDDISAVRDALERRGVATGALMKNGTLVLVPPNSTYDVRGKFEPEDTIRVFSTAIEEALSDGFSGFRAAANMAWALDLPNGAERLITYEALLRSLFVSSRATGLCLYDAGRTPLQVVDGVLCTHPLVRAFGAYEKNDFYEERRTSLGTPRDEGSIRVKIEHFYALPSARKSTRRRV
jgi:chemotaxis family two-component system sensor kinase Cph1